jgi:hypothetical protein
MIFMIRKHARKPSYKEVHSLNSLSYTHISFAGQLEMEIEEFDKLEDDNGDTE